MKKHIKTIAAILALVLAISCLWACAGTKGNSGATSAAIEDGILTAGTNAAFPPFEYAGADGAPDGFDIALIKAIGEKLGVEVQVVDMEFNSLVSSVGSKIDCAIAGMTVKPDREEVVDFSDTYYTATQYVLVAADDDSVAAVEDLNGKIIGTQLGTTGQIIAEDELEAKEVKSYDKAVDAVNDLKNGRIDAVVIDSNPAMVFASENDTIKIVGEDFFAPEYYAIALPEGDTALVEQVNGALEAIKADGTFDALVAEYIETDK